MNTSPFLKHAKLLFAAVATTCAILPSSVSAGPAILDTAINPANGHTYYLLDNSDWTNAEATAVEMGGHLATVNDLAENNWIWDRWGTNRSLWIGLHDPVTGDGGATQHANNFIWSSGDTSTFRNWRSGEPNGDQYTYVLAKEIGLGGVWNDAANLTKPAGEPSFFGVVEIPICTPHGATATAVLYNNFVVNAVITDSGCGYTNPPVVTIEGGGGSGATATATINANGNVTAINITSTGTGYTNAPEILFSSPPFEPSVSIAVSKIKVTQHVMLDVNYILQTSTNLLDWTATGPSFTATNENMVTEFDVNAIGRYFRLMQVQ